MRNGSKSSQTNGYATRANKASGQQRTKRIHQSRNANMAEISFSLDNCTFLARVKFHFASGGPLFKLLAEGGELLLDFGEFLAQASDFFFDRL